MIRRELTTKSPAHIVSPPTDTCLSTLLSSIKLVSSGTASSLLGVAVEGALEKELGVLKPAALKVFWIVVSVKAFHATSIHQTASNAVVLGRQESFVVFFKFS